MKYIITEGQLRDIVRQSVGNVLDRLKNIRQKPAFDKSQFDWVSDFFYGFAIVEKNSKFNVIDKSGNLISPEWLDNIHYIAHFGASPAIFDDEGKTYVEINGEYYKLTEQGELSKATYKDVRDFHDA